jgi:hypothetical protein
MLIREKRLKPYVMLIQEQRLASCDWLETYVGLIREKKLETYVMLIREKQLASLAWLETCVMLVREKKYACARMYFYALKQQDVSK